MCEKDQTSSADFIVYQCYTAVKIDFTRDGTGLSRYECEKCIGDFSRAFLWHSSLKSLAAIFCTFCCSPSGFVFSPAAGASSRFQGFRPPLFVFIFWSGFGNQVPSSFLYAQKSGLHGLTFLLLACYLTIHDGTSRVSWRSKNKTEPLHFPSSYNFNKWFVWSL